MSGLGAFINGTPLSVQSVAGSPGRKTQSRRWAVHLLSANGELLHELRFRSYGAAEAFCEALPPDQDFILVGAVS